MYGTMSKLRKQEQVHLKFYKITNVPYFFIGAGTVF